MSSFLVKLVCCEITERDLASRDSRDLIHCGKLFQLVQRRKKGGYERERETERQRGREREEKKRSRSGEVK